MSRICILFLLLLTAAAPVPLWADMARFNGVPVSGVSVEGLPETIDQDVAAGLALGAPVGIFGASRPTVVSSILESDTRRIRLLLARNGYPWANIETRFENDGDDASVGVVFIVAPGRPVRTGKLEITGLPAELQELHETAGQRLPRDTIFTDQIVAETRRHVADNLLAAGYALSDVDLTVSRPDSYLADLQVAVTAGRRYSIDSVSASGVAEDLAALACKTMAAERGKHYSPEALSRARGDLRDLQLFRQIRVVTRPADSLSLDLHAELKAGLHRSSRVSAGTWSDDWLRLKASWRDRNFFGGGRGLGVRGSWSAHHIEGGAGVWWPAMPRPRSRTELWLRYIIENEDSYFLRTAQLEVATLLKFARRTTLRLGAALENVSVDEFDVGSWSTDNEGGRQLVLSSRYFRDASDHLLSPTRGTRLTVDLELAPAAEISQSPYWSAETTGVLYMALPARLVLASRISTGQAGPLGNSASLLPNTRYRAGGVSTMRGYRRHLLGPRDAAGDPAGGEARLLGSLELRCPLKGFLGLVMFVDSGQVWWHREDFDLADLEYAAGGGLVFNTPVGPIRLESARQLTTPDTGERETVFHIAIGHPY